MHLNVRMHKVSYSVLHPESINPENTCRFILDNEDASLDWLLI